MTPPSRQFKILDPRLPAGTDSMDWTNGLAVGTLAICATIIAEQALPSHATLPITPRTTVLAQELPTKL